MAVEAFGVTPQVIMDLFQKTLPASAVAIIQRWINNAAGRLSLMLAAQNYTAAEIVALGTESAAYLLCQDYVQVKAGARAHQSFARNQTTLADGFFQEARELEALIRSMAEVLNPDKDRNELRSTFRGATGARARSLATWSGRITASERARRVYGGACARRSRGGW